MQSYLFEVAQRRKKYANFIKITPKCLPQKQSYDSTSFNCFTITFHSPYFRDINTKLSVFFFNFSVFLLFSIIIQIDLFRKIFLCNYNSLYSFSIIIRSIGLSSDYQSDMDLQNPAAAPKALSNARGSYSREVSPDPMYLNKVRSEFITNPVIQPAESPKKHNFNRTRLSSKKKSAQPSLNVRQILRENGSNSQLSEKHKGQQKEQTIMDRDTAEQSRNRLQRLMESHNSVTSKNTRSVSKPNSAVQSPSYRGSSQPRTLQKGGNDVEQGMISPSKPTVGINHGRLTMSGQKTDQRPYASKSKDTSRTRVFETCEQLKEFAVGDSAKASEYDPKPFVDGSEDIKPSMRNSVVGKDVNDALVNVQGTVTLEVNNLEVEPQHQSSTAADDPSILTSIQHNFSQYAPYTLHKKQMSSPIRGSDQVRRVSESILNENSIDQQPISGHNLSSFVMPPMSAKVDFTDPLQSQYSLQYNMSKDESNKKLRIQKGDHYIKQRQTVQTITSPSQQQFSNKLGNVRSYMDSTLSMERRLVKGRPTTKTQNNFNRPKSNLTTSGTGFINRQQSNGNMQDILKKKKSLNNGPQSQLKSACSTYAGNAPPKTRTNSTNQNISKIGKNSFINNDLSKRSGNNKQNSVDFNSSIQAVQITLEKYNQRKKSALVNTASNRQYMVKTSNHSKYLNHLQSQKNLTYRQKDNSVAEVQLKQAQPGSQPTTTTNAVAQSKKDITSQLVDRLYNDKDERKKRKENLQKKLLDDKHKELTMVPKINKKSEILYKQKVVNKRILTLEGVEGSSSSRQNTSKQSNFFLNKYKQASPTIGNSRNQSMSPKRTMSTKRKEQTQNMSKRDSNVLNKSTTVKNLDNNNLKNPAFLFRAATSNTNLSQTQLLQKNQNYFKGQRHSLKNINNISPTEKKRNHSKSHSIREEADAILKEISIEVDRIDKLQEEVIEQQKDMFDVLPNTSSIFNSQIVSSQQTPRNNLKPTYINNTIKETTREGTEKYQNQEMVILDNNQNAYQDPVITRFGSQNQGTRPLQTNESDVMIDYQHQMEPGISQTELKERPQSGLDSRLEIQESVRLRTLDSDMMNNRKMNKDLTAQQNHKEDLYKYLAINKMEKIKKLEEEKNLRELQDCTFQPQIIETKSSARFGQNKRSIQDNNADLVELGNEYNQFDQQPQQQKSSQSSRYKSTDGHLSVFKKLASQKSRDYNKYEQDKLQRESEGCTFKPDIEKTSALFKSIDAHSNEHKIPVYQRKQKREDFLTKRKQQFDEGNNAITMQKSMDNIKNVRQNSKHRFRPDFNLYKQKTSPGPGPSALSSGRLSNGHLSNGRLSLRKRSQDPIERNARNQAIAESKKKFDRTQPFDKEMENENEEPQVNNIILNNQVFQIQTTNIQFLDLPSGSQSEMSDAQMKPSVSYTPVSQQNQSQLIHKTAPDMPNQVYRESRNMVMKPGSNSQTMQQTRKFMPYTPHKFDLNFTDDTTCVQPAIVSIKDDVPDQQRTFDQSRTYAASPPLDQNVEAQLQPPLPRQDYPTPQNSQNDRDSTIPVDKEKEKTYPSVSTTIITKITSHRRKSNHSPRRKRRDRKTSNVLGNTESSLGLFSKLVDKKSNDNEGLLDQESAQIVQ